MLFAAGLNAGKMGHMNGLPRFLFSYYMKLWYRYVKWERQGRKHVLSKKLVRIPDAPSVAKVEISSTHLAIYI